MIISIYIRPLVIRDALTSYMWSNDPQIWNYTMKKMTRYISPEIETEWLRECLTHTDQANFAICVRELDTYIGNVRLVDVKDKTAEVHIFIGNKLYWGKGIGYQAIIQILEYGFFEAELESVFLRVHPANISAIRVYEQAGFEIKGRDEGFIVMDISKREFIERQIPVRSGGK